MPYIIYPTINRQRTVIIAFLLIFALAAYLRFDFLVSVQHKVSHDTVNYDLMVRQLLEHGVYAYGSEESNAKVPPGYPLLMAAVYKLVGYEQHDPFPAIRYLQALMSLTAIWIGVRIASRLGGTAASLATAAIMAVYPPFIWANGAILTETLAALLLLLYLDLQLIALDKLTIRSSVLAGAGLALAMLVRSEYAVLLLAAYLFMWLRNKTSARRIGKLFLCAGLGAALVLAPWLTRNIVTLHQATIASTQVNPLAAGTYPNKNYKDGLVDTHGKTQMQVAKERLRIGFTQHTWTYIKWYTVGKLKFIYNRPFFGSGHSPLYPVIPMRRPLHLAIIGGGIVFAALLLRHWRRPAMLITVCLATISLVRLAFVPEYRYNFTAMPLFIVLDGLLVSALYNWYKRRAQSTSRSVQKEVVANAAP